MREFAKVSPQFWINESGRKLKKLGLEAQLMAFYLLTNPHASMIGIYYLPVTLMAHETGIPLEGALQGLERLIEIHFCSFDPVTEYVWVHEMAFNQIGMQLKPNDNRIKAINDAYAGLPDLPFLQAFYAKYAQSFYLQIRQDFLSSLQAPSESLSSKEKDKEKEKEKEKEIKIFMQSKSDMDCLDKHQAPTFKSQAIEILQFLNEKTGRVYRPVDANLKLIMARLKTGATVVNCRQVIAKKTREWKGDSKMAEYLRPATLFNAVKFEQYMGELVVPKEKEEANE